MTGISELVAVGFNGENGTFRARARVELNSFGMHFFEVRITVDGSNSVVTVVVPKIALKVTRESTSLAADRDGDEIPRGAEAAGHGHVHTKKVLMKMSPNDKEISNAYLSKKAFRQAAL